MQERILSHLDQVQDIVALGSASSAAQAAVAHASWTGVHCLRLVGIVQSPVTLLTGVISPVRPCCSAPFFSSDLQRGHC